MRITTRGRYALRASLALARIQNPGAPVSIGQISEEERISSIFLEQIFFKLRKAGIVGSVRGPGGGFFFAKPLESLTLKEILQAAGEELDVTECDKRAKSCKPNESRCRAHSVWEDVTRLINQYFEGITLAAELNRGKKPARSSD
jgi:Rrf2 family iron-sulfur cluster assembly transcriptional regulator